MINLDWLIWEDNPKDIPCTETHFYKWLSDEPYYDRRVDAVKSYLIDRYGWEKGKVVLSGGLATLCYIYDAWWYNWARPLREASNPSGVWPHGI